MVIIVEDRYIMVEGRGHKMQKYVILVEIMWSKFCRFKILL